jgi:hypothetical protein
MYSGSRSWATVAPGPKIRMDGSSSAFVELLERRGAYVVLRQLRDVVRQVDDADRTLGIDV